MRMRTRSDKNPPKMGRTHLASRPLQAHIPSPSLTSGNGTRWSLANGRTTIHLHRKSDGKGDG